MERVRGAGNAEQSLQTGDNTALMAAVVVAIARAREDPLAVIARFQRRLTLYNGVSYADPNKPPGRRTVTKEGAAAVEDAIRYLSRMKGGGNFSSKNIEGLALAAEDHADDIGRNGCVSHTGSDGSTVADRQMRYGRWAGYAGECLWYGCAEYAVSGESIVDDLIVDDGVPSRGHRWVRRLLHTAIAFLLQFWRDLTSLFNCVPGSHPHRADSVSSNNGLVLPALPLPPTRYSGRSCASSLRERLRQHREMCLLADSTPGHR